MLKLACAAIVAFTVLTSCGSQATRTVTTTTSQSAATTTMSANTTTAHHRRTRRRPRSTPKPATHRRPSGYASTYPAPYAKQQVAECISMKTMDPSLMGPYCRCFVNTLMRRVPYAVEQHDEPASKVGLPTTWMSQIVSGCMPAG